MAPVVAAPPTATAEPKTRGESDEHRNDDKADDDD
jgi:hypothetical protein